MVSFEFQGFSKVLKEFQVISKDLTLWGFQGDIEGARARVSLGVLRSFRGSSSGFRGF